MTAPATPWAGIDAPLWEEARRLASPRLTWPRLAAVGLLASLLLVSPPSTKKAEALTETFVLLELLAFFQTYVVPVLDFLEGLPATLDGAVLAGIERTVGQYAGSYLRTSGLARFETLFPSFPTLFAPDDAVAYVASRQLDTTGRVNEVMDNAYMAAQDTLAATDRLQALVDQNTEILSPSISETMRVAVQGIAATDGGVEKLVALQAEQMQLDAQRALDDDWRNTQADARWRFIAPTWHGTATWQPVTIRTGFGGGG